MRKLGIEKRLVGVILYLIKILFYIFLTENEIMFRAFSSYAMNGMSFVTSAKYPKKMVQRLIYWAGKTT